MSYEDDCNTRTQTILDQAQNAIESSIQGLYGQPMDSFNKISEMWSAYLSIPITEFDVINMMIALKLVKGYKGYDRENMIDIAGYAYCAELINNSTQEDRE